ncbi:hypothetical protein K1719_032171 [Acacia pycnantha]|nr:hypothetical protein K1719_032171 [Acacia pycnantha]
MCVELDLTKPLVPEFKVEGQIQSVVYESMGMLCTKCGLLGHSKEGCEEQQRRKSDVTMDVEDVGEKGKVDEVVVEKKDRWKTVQRPRRQRYFDGPAKAQQSRSRFCSYGGDDGTVNILWKVEGAHEPKLVADSQERGLGSVECVSESNLELYRPSGVEHCDKENLQPGAQQGRLNCNDDMEMENVLKWADDEDVIASNGLGTIKEFMTLPLANDRGVAGKGIAAVIRDMKRRYKVDIVVILETRINGKQATKVIKGWGFQHSCRMEVEGSSGGIWILWEMPDLVVDVLVNDEQFIHCRLRLGVENMVLTAVYASPNEHKRSRIWGELYKIVGGTAELWLIAGDFNEIKSPLEQKGGGRVNESRCRNFNE